MNISVMFVDCPEYMDSGGAARCGLPAAMEYRYTVSSTNGPLESRAGNYVVIRSRRRASFLQLISATGRGNARCELSID